MADKRKKRKRKTKGAASSGTGAPSHSSGGAQSGGLLQSMRSGLRRVAGAESGKQEESTLSKVIWALILLAAIAFAATRYFGLWDNDEGESSEEPAEGAERTPEKAPTKAAPSPDERDESGHE